MPLRRSPPRLVVIAAAAGGLVATASCRHGEGAGAALKIAGGEAVLSSSHPAADAIARATVRIRLPANETCSGTLVTPRIVVTAAHCVYRNAFDMQVYPSVDYTVEFVNFEPVQSQKVKSDTNVFMHAGYQPPANGSLVKDDIAFLRLNADAPSSYSPAHLLAATAPIQTIELGASSIAKRGQRFLVAGYGRLAAASPATAFHMTEMELYVRDAAAGRLAFSDDGSGPCRGDSGGPNYIFEGGKLVLASVTSMASCDKKMTVDVQGSPQEIVPYMLYSTDVRSFTPWLKSKLGAADWQKIKTSAVGYSPMVDTRTDAHTRALVAFFESEIQ